MKYLLPILSLVLLFTISSCRKDNSTFVNQTSSGGQQSSSYYPVTKGSERTYIATTGNTSIKSKETITGVTAEFNGKTYYEVVVKVEGYADENKGYYYEGNNTYSLRSTSLVHGITIDMEYMNDKEAIGYSWTKTITPNGKINDIPARIIGTIKEKNISKTVQGKVYNDVIHTTVELQYDYFSGFEKAATYEFYNAKGIGTILVESTIDTFGFVLTSKTELLSYQIK
ncbi:MAG: hypothetical protein ACO1N7_12135 [Sphingobacteriaceae bacterium]